MSNRTNLNSEIKVYGGKRYEFCNFKKNRRTFYLGKQYECTNIYHGFIDVLDEHRELIKVSLDDSDFLFVLNAKEDDMRKML